MGNRNRRQDHAYNPDEMERLRGIQLPPKMKCNMCLRNYNAANFSEKQKTDARWQISKQGRITTNPRCFKCTGGQLVEIECSHCHKTKGLEDFAKSQRRKPGDAQCYACTEVQLSREAVEQHEEDYDKPGKAFFNTESSGGRAPEYWSSIHSSRTESSNGDWTETTSVDGGRRKQEEGAISLSTHLQQAMSVSGEVSDTLIDSDFSYKPANDTKSSTYSEVAGTESWHTGTQTASSTRSTITTGYGRPSTRSVSGSVHTFDSSIAERSQPARDRFGTRSGFAKVKAYKPPTELQEGDNFSGDENSSSDDDDDDDSDGEI
ncbi:hypothetical protein N0V91_010073 [Didymella pomorum]|uniref:Stc1 domain-containing protein n=1 Tax=Didymella pomorum TaxID=749634 RepID=A0A9W9D2W5_9PLEO|nr:hypothetical protein N0V91_010073 [Didymella pomorum]